MRAVGILIGSMATGAFAAAIAWWVFGDVRIGGGPLRETLFDGLFREVWAAVIAGAAVGAVRGVLAAKADRQRSADLPICARELGMEYEDDAKAVFDRHVGLRDLSVFDDLSRAEALYSGARGGRPVEVFDLTTTTTSSTPNGSSTATRRRTVAVVPDLGLPAFEVSPKGAVVRLIVRGLGVEGLRFDPNAADDPDHAEIIERFRRRYFVFAQPHGNAPGAVPPTPDETGQVRRLFSAEVMGRLVAWPGYTVHSEGGHLVLSRFPGPVLPFLPVARRARLIEDAEAIASGMLAAAETSAPVILASGEAASSDSARLDRGCRRIVAGLLLGFFGGMAVNFAIFFSSDDPGSTMWLLPATFFGGPIAGAIVAGLLNAVLPPPKPPVAEVARRPTTLLGTVLGTVGAAFLGLLGLIVGGFGAATISEGLKRVGVALPVALEGLFFLLFVIGGFVLGIWLGRTAGRSLGDRLCRDEGEDGDTD